MANGTRNISLGFVGPPVSYGRDTEGSWTKENKKANVLQRGSWEIYKKVSVHLSSSHCSLFCMSGFTNILKLPSVFVLSCKIFLCMFWWCMCSVSFVCSLGNIRCAGSEMIWFIPASEQNVQVLIYTKQQDTGALLMHYDLFVFILFHQLSNDDAARMASPQFLNHIFLWDKSLDLFLMSSNHFWFPLALYCSWQGLSVTNTAQGLSNYLAFSCFAFNWSEFNGMYRWPKSLRKLLIQVLARSRPI